MTYLKFRWGLSYEEVAREVREGIDSATLETHVHRDEAKERQQAITTPTPKTIPEGKPENQFDGRWLVIGAFVVCLSWALLMASVGWNNSLSDQHGFRQTQTAITSYYLTHGGPFLSYETPVLGRPWSIPFEFPLYQWIVASASAVFKSPLNQTGRFISELFFYLSLMMIWFLLAELSIRPVYRLVFLSLALASPEYVFWSRTFMIESTALFFCMGYLLFACRYARDRSPPGLVLGGTFGVLAALVKTTTMPSFVIAAALFYVSTFRNHSTKIKVVFSRNCVPILFFVCLPVLAMLIWTHYTDDVRSLNVVGTRTTSSALKGWIFGSFSQRLSPDTWKIMFDRIIPDLVGGNVIFLLPLFGIFFARDRLFPFLTCILGFLSAFLIFTNLHVVHNYYTYANGIFVIAASSWSVVGLLEQKRWQQLLGMVIFFLMLLVSVKGYYNRYYTAQKDNALNLDKVAQAINQMVQPGEMILVFGQDWSSELPYYSERRALMWPAWMPQEIDSPEMREALSKLGDTRVGALVVCDSARKDSHLIERATDVLSLAGRPKYEDEICAVYGRTSRAERTGLKPRDS